jgi:hypothetical protein
LAFFIDGLPTDDDPAGVATLATERGELAVEAHGSSLA